jgi:hypothetical protein
MCCRGVVDLAVPFVEMLISSMVLPLLFAVCSPLLCCDMLTRDAALNLPSGGLAGASGRAFHM